MPITMKEQRARTRDGVKGDTEEIMQHEHFLWQFDGHDQVSGIHHHYRHQVAMWMHHQ
jgi:hypothetical protein